jgi:hypothetical protein
MIAEVGTFGKLHLDAKNASVKRWFGAVAGI